MLSRPERKREGLRLSEFLKLTGNKLMHPSVLDGQKTAIAPLAGKEVMPCSEFDMAWRFGNEANRSFGKTKGATPPR